MGKARRYEKAIPFLRTEKVGDAVHLEIKNGKARQGLDCEGLGRQR